MFYFDGYTLDRSRSDLGKRSREADFRLSVILFLNV
jgi:hypothetical protein